MLYYIKVDGSLMSDTEAWEILDEGTYKALQFFVENGSIPTTEISDETDDYDDSDWKYEESERRGCSDCPDDECTGHCMSCYYRPV